MESTSEEIETDLKTVDAISVNVIQKLTDFTDSKIPSEIVVKCEGVVSGEGRLVGD